MSRTRKNRRLIAVCLALFTLLAIAGAAAAHPLGNFTISRYSALTLRQAAIDVLYIVDMAEIPTVQEQQAMDSDGDGAVSPSEEAAWLAATVPALAANLSLTVDGAPVTLSPRGHTLTFPPGQGDLPTLRLEVQLSAALPATDEARALAYEDGNFAGRLGWQEIIATAADGALLDASVPAADLSDQLRNYPADLLQAPPAVSTATVRHAPAAAATTTGPTPAAESTAVTANRFGQDEFANLLNRTLDTPGALLAALLVAVGLGAAHALTPGHGKTIVGAYLVGSRGTARHALFLGLTTTITHTAGVFALGFLVLAASEFVLPEKLYPWLGVMSGLLVVFIGLSILRGHVGHWLAHRRGETHDHGHYHFHFGKGHSHGPDDHHHAPTADATPAARRQATDHGATVGGQNSPAGQRTLAFAAVSPTAVTYSPALPHSHAHDDHDHSHGGHTHTHGDHEHHDHYHGHTHHSHARGNDNAARNKKLGQQGGGDALSWRNLLALGISGGLLPCPSALILMLSAIALHQVGLGLTLIVAFSIGLAGVLTSIGLIMVYAGRFLERLPVRHTALTARFLPMASATFITLAGLLITVRALVEAGVLRL